MCATPVDERFQQKVSAEMKGKESGAPSWLYAIVSAAILIPCFWHRQIEAGDLASHAYNAWLAQLIASGKAPGLYISHQLNNVLFDVLLFHAANLFGFAIAQRIVVSLCVLIFFWGVFAFVATACGKRPWALTPCMAMLAYGYCFNMGFFNFYLSLGLACFALALIWERPARSWRGAAVLLPLIFAAHPLGAVWLCSAAAYRKASQRLQGYWRLGTPIVATCGVLGIFLVFGTGGQVSDRLARPSVLRKKRCRSDFSLWAAIPSAGNRCSRFRSGLNGVLFE